MKIVLAGKGRKLKSDLKFGKPKADLSIERMPFGVGIRNILMSLPANSKKDLRRKMASSGCAVSDKAFINAIYQAREYGLVRYQRQRTI